MSDRISNYETDWQGYSGAEVQQFIKDRLQGMERGKQDTLSLGTGLVMNGSELSVSLSTSQIDGMEHEVGRIATLEASKQDAISLGTGLEWSGDTIGLMLGEGLSIDACGRIVAEGESYTAGSGVDILDGNTIAISTGYGLDVNESNQLTVQTAEYSPIAVTQDGLKINYGTGLATSCGTLLLDNSYIGLPNKVSNIELSLQFKQNTLVAGSGIAIEDGQNISLKVATGLEFNDSDELTVNISTEQVSGIEEYVAFVASDKQDKLAYYTESGNTVNIIASNEILLDTGQVDTGTYLQLMNGLGAFGYGGDVGITASADGIKLLGTVSLDGITNLAEEVGKISSKQNKLTAGTGIKLSGDIISVSIGTEQVDGLAGVVTALEDSISNKQDRLMLGTGLQWEEGQCIAVKALDLVSCCSIISFSDESGFIVKLSCDLVNYNGELHLADSIHNQIEGKQDSLTAGTGIKLSDNVISVSISTEQVNGLAGVVTALDDSISNKQDKISTGCGMVMCNNQISLSCEIVALPSVVEGKQDALQFYKECGAVAYLYVPNGMYMETFSGMAAFTMEGCGAINLTAPRVDVSGTLNVQDTDVMTKINQLDRSLGNKMDWFSVGDGLYFRDSEVRLPNLASSLHNGAVDKASSYAQKVLNLSCGNITIKLATGLGIDECGYLYVL